MGTVYKAELTPPTLKKGEEEKIRVEKKETWGGQKAIDKHWVIIVKEWKSGFTKNEATYNSLAEI